MKTCTRFVGRLLWRGKGVDEEAAVLESRVHQPYRTRKTQRRQDELHLCVR